MMKKTNNRQTNKDKRMDNNSNNNNNDRSNNLSIRQVPAYIDFKQVWISYEIFMF